MRKCTAESGNVFFLIFLGIAIFGALTYAFMPSLRTSQSSISREMADLYANSIIDYGATLTDAMTRMVVGRGITDYTIEFGNDGLNPNCTLPKCKLFGPQGGAVPRELNLPAQLKNQSVDTTNFQYHIILANVVDVGTAADDVILQLERLDPIVCDAINRKLGITGQPVYNEAPSTDISATPISLGAWPDPAGEIGEEGTAAQLIGKRAGCGCLTANCSDPYDTRYYEVIYAR